MLIFKVFIIEVFYVGIRFHTRYYIIRLAICLRLFVFIGLGSRLVSYEDI